MKKTLYIIPGHGEKITLPRYKKLIKELSSLYNVKGISVSFNKKTGSFLNSTNSALKQINSKNTSKSVLFGFSEGALFAYQIAGDLTFENVVVASIMPILEKDLAPFAESDKLSLFTKEQLEEFTRIKYKEPKSRMTIVYGEKELDNTILRSKKLAKKYKLPLVKIKDGEHALNDEYIKKIVELIKNGHKLN